MPSWLRLAKPIAARLGSDGVLVLDLGASGALLSGRGQFTAGAEHTLSFADAGLRVQLRCMVTGVEEHLQTPDRDLVVRFLERNEALESFISGYREQVRLAAEANARGEIAENVIDGDRTLSDLGSAMRSNPAFVRCRFDGDKWSRERTPERDQPHDGFTIAAYEPDEQIGLLQQAYEESDDAGRHLLREFAAASLAKG